MNDQISKDIKQNKKRFEKIFSDCADLKQIPMRLGKNQDVEAFLVYIEITLAGSTFASSMMGELVTGLSAYDKNELVDVLARNGLGLGDITYFQTVSDACQGMLAGELMLFVDGFDQIIKVPDRGYPSLGIQEAESEKVIRGSKEGFADSIKTNVGLIRKRLRSLDLKNRQYRIGKRTQTNVNVLYMDGIAKMNVVDELEEKLNAFVIDGILDSGQLSQLAEKQWLSPFPQFQSTERPDKAVHALLEGRVVLLCDNSPLALLLPTDFNSFLQTSDDYYNRWEIASFGRLIRYIAAFFAMSLPGLYLAVIGFHASMLPTELLLSFAQARAGIPYSSLVELLLMELSFELLREAGVRLPGTMGNTIGIVGGLIIGSAAVEAGLVSPVVVIVVAFTALCSFAIPNEEFETAFRLLKFVLIFVCAWLGFFGFLCTMLFLLLHLGSLRSLGVDYLSPFVGSDTQYESGRRDTLLRLPLSVLRLRPGYAKETNRVRFRWTQQKNGEKGERK